VNRETTDNLQARRNRAVDAHIEAEFVGHDAAATAATFRHPRYEIVAAGIVSDGRQAGGRAARRVVRRIPRSLDPYIGAPSRGGRGDRGVHPGRHAYTADMPDQFIDAAVDAAETFSSPASSILLFRIHGLATRVPAADTAFGLRGEKWDFNIVTQWFDTSEAAHHKAWTRDHWNRLQGLMNGSAYMNHLAADDGAERVRAAFGPNYARLAKIKAKYDPENLFRLNPDIPPAPTAGA
jgi:FAD/FMN-containing dehydrogenase